MSERRLPISKKLRFEIFKRDGFLCQYCGAYPSETVLLEIDHVVPVSENGSDEIDDLITACFDCNRGKSSNLLNQLPQSVEEKTAVVIERESQVRAYYQVLEQQKIRKDDEIWAIAGIFMDRFGETEITRSRLASIRMFLQKLNFYEVQEAMEIAVDRHYSRTRVFLYFCGICWRKIKRASGEE